MRKTTKFLAAATVSALFALPGFAQESDSESDTPEVMTADADTVVAVVGGEEITVGHLIAMRMTLSQQNLQLPDNVIFEGLLERIIQQRAVAQSVDEVAKGTELAVENERAALIASRQVTAIAEAIDITDEMLQEAYDAEYAEFEPVREFNASHILVATEEEAQAIIEELNGGADFAEVAKEKSTGPSGVNGGELGWFGPGMMVPTFEEAVVAMEEGTISEPVQTQFGWHVIKLNETRLPEAPALDTVREEITNRLWEEALREKVSAIVEGAGVERPDLSGIDPAILRDTSLIGF